MTIQSYAIMALIATNIVLAVCLVMLPRRRKMRAVEIADALDEMAKIKTSVLYSKRALLHRAAEKLRDQQSDIDTLQISLWRTRAWYNGGYQPHWQPGKPTPPSKEN